MGGSKPSQFWQKEPPATDRKWRAEDEGVLEREKHELASNEAQDREMIPQPKPAARKRATSRSQGKKRAGKRKKSGR
jgi:hypothetical protein